MDRMILFGPPGTGKTYSLLEYLERELKQGVPIERIAFLTFTRRAKREAVERVGQVLGIKATELPNFRTIHSLAFRALRLKDGDVMGKKQLDEFGLHMGLTFGNTSVSEQASEGINSQAIGDQMAAIDNLCRLRGETLRKTWSNARSNIEWPVIEHFSASYLAYKQEHGLLDFTDVLQEFARRQLRIDIDVAFIDEAQDLSALQWYAVLQACEGAQRQYVAGDDDQCQVAGTMIDTPSGRIPIERLRNGDRVIAYDINAGAKVGQRNPIKIKTHRRKYTGPLFTITVGKRSTTMTPEHLCLVRFTKKANARKVVYLMRRGNNWRIGQTQLRNVDGVVMLGTKLRMEGADALWVLRIVETGNDALYYEQLYSTMYQIPQLRFTYTRMDGTLGILKQEQLDMIHACSDSHAHAALRCLNAFSLDIRYPFWTLARSASKLGGKVTFTLEACNVLPDVMIMMDTTRVWQSLSVSVSHMKRGYVYSIAVEKYKNYFADGVLIHNCIYRWSGADVKFFMGLPGERRILNQSFRLPRVVHALSSAIIKRVKTRVPKVFRARDAEGAIKYHPSFESLDIGEGKWLWLVRNRYLLAGLRGALQRNGIVFSSHGHSSINESERDAIYDWERLRSGKSVPVHRVRDIYSYLKSRTQIKHGFKLLPGVDESAELIMIELVESYGLLATGTWFEVFTSIPDERRAYYRALLRNRKTLKLAPQVQLETIHGSKGAEADNVAVFLEQSRRVWDESQHNIESAEDEHRVFYVAATRAKESLHVVSSGARWGYMMPTVSMK